MSSSSAAALASAVDKRSGRKQDGAIPTEAMETNSIVFEWPLHGLKTMFDSSRSDTKSKVVKSSSFGGGRWTVLFYAQSGHEQFCSLYLNAEPLANERIHPLLAGAQLAMEGQNAAATTSTPSKSSKGEFKPEEKWFREGLFRFTFNIQTLDKTSVLGTKEAHDHAFCYKTSNWGWAQFAKRDTVYYNNANVRNADGFLISVTIQSSPEKPRLAQPIAHTVPPVLIQAMGSLLDDPEHSDLVFHLPSPRRGKRRSRPKKIYAIKKILASRSEYFKDMFEGGFLEAEQAESSEDEDGGGGAATTRKARSTAHPQRSHETAARAADGDDLDMASADDGGDDEEDDEEGHGAYGPEALLEDSDEEIDDDDDGSEPVEPRGRTHTQLSLGSGAPSSSSAVAGVNTPPARMARLAGRDTESVNDSGDDRDDDDDELPEEDEVVAVSGRAAGDAAQNVAGAADAQEGKGEAAPTTTTTTPQLGSGSLTTPSPARTATASPTARNNVATPAKRNLSAQGEVQPGPSKTGGKVGVKEAKDRRKRRKVVVRDSAYPTFKALLFFLYTDTVEFAPLTSSFLPAEVANDETLGSSFARRPNGTFADEMRKAHKRRQAVIDNYCRKHPGKPSPCSAKAMYKLADKLQIPDLKKRAQEHIANSLTVANITFECFSSFATRYPDIRKMETDFLLRNWRAVKSSAAMKTVFSRGATAHPGLAEVWPDLLQCLEYRPPGSGDEEGDAFADER